MQWYKVRWNFLIVVRNVQHRLFHPQTQVTGLFRLLVLLLWQKMAEQSIWLTLV
jgi:hypothetical protein